MSQRRNKKKSTPNQKVVEARGQGQPSPETTSSASSRRAQRRIQAERNRRRQRLYMVGGAIALAVIIVGALILINRPEDEGEAANLPVTVPPGIDPSIPREGRTLGNPDAPLTVVEFADFQCPACGQFAINAKPQFINDFIATGQVKLEFHDFPFLDDRSSGNESNEASEAAYCALDQGRFWEYHDMLFYNQSGENQGAFARSRLIEMARNVEGLDVDQFTNCLEDNQFEDEVNDLYESAIDQGVNSTPTFMFDGRTISGSNYANLKAEIEAALAD